MSKVSFRARQIDFNKPLPIIRNDSEVHSDISENALVNRGVPVLPSGMEKEEENEHHLVEVLHALQTKKASDVVIPVPEIEEDTNAYFSLYEKGFSPPNHFIHIRTIVLAEEEPIEYDMDSEDEVWLSKNEEMNITPDQFESMIYTLERGCGQKVINLDEAKCLLQNYDTSLVIAIYDYWLTKRVQSRQPLILTVRQEKRTNDTANDPYIAFRRRTERMQTRKNRKNDEYSYEKMLILREQMESLGDIIERLVKRECLKKELVDIEKKIFSSRYQSKDFEGYLINEISSQCYKATSKEKSFSQDSSSINNNYFQESAKRHRSTIKQNKKKRLQKKTFSAYTNDKLINLSGGEVSDEENIFSSENESQSLTSPASSASPFSSFVRQKGCKYLRPCSRLDLESLRTPSSPTQSRLLHHHPYLSYTLHHKFPNFAGYTRRRIGRGGRLIIDRVPCETETKNLSYHTLSSNSSRCINDIEFLRNRVKVLTSQTLSLRQGRLVDKNTPKSELYNSISNRLRWSSELNNWETFEHNYNSQTDFHDNSIPLKNKFSNSSYFESSTAKSYDSRSPPEKIFKCEQENFDPPPIIQFPDKNSQSSNVKMSNVDQKSENEFQKTNSWSEDSLNEPKSSRARPNSQGEQVINSIPNSSFTECTSTTISTHQQSYGKSAKEWISVNSKRRISTLSSKLTNSNSLDRESSQASLTKANGSSNYCFFVPTPNNNSQTASNV